MESLLDTSVLSFNRGGLRRESFFHNRAQGEEKNLNLAQTLDLFACGCCQLMPGTRVQIYGRSEGGLVSSKAGRTVIVRLDGGEIITRDQNEVYPETNGEPINQREKMRQTGYDDRNTTRRDPRLPKPSAFAVGYGPLYKGIAAEFGAPGATSVPNQIEPLPKNDVPSLKNRPKVISDEEQEAMEEKVMPTASRARKAYLRDRWGHIGGLQSW